MSGTTLSVRYTAGYNLTVASQNPVTVTSSGTISAGSHFAALYGNSGADWTVANYGTIASPTGAGVWLTAGGNVTNAASALIAGGGYGIGILGGSGTLVNDGSVTGTSGYAVYLKAGGYVTNAHSGTISAGQFGVEVLHGAGTIINEGSVSGNRDGVYLQAGGSVTNAAGGNISSGKYGVKITGGGGYVSDASGAVISSAKYGVEIRDAAGTVTNDGMIIGNSRGIVLGDGGYMINTASGVIAGGFAVDVANAAGTIVNAGNITALGSGIAVLLTAGGDVTNNTSATISGNGYGIDILGGAGAVVNDGNIIGSSGFGAYLEAGGSVTNASNATIAGGKFGVEIAGGLGTVTNAGTIQGATAAVDFNNAGGNSLIIDPGAVFLGAVEASGTGNLLELASGSGAGTISSIGGQYVGFSSVMLDAGATWSLTGASALTTGQTLTNDGTLVLTNASFTDAGGFGNNGQIVIDPSNVAVDSLEGSGTVTIETGSTLDVLGSVSADETIVFDGTGNLFEIGNPTAMAGTISGFTVGDTIDLIGIAAASATVSGSELVVSLSAGGTLDYALGNFTAGDQISISSDLAGGTDLDVIPCFCAGTHIRTPDGELAVETLKIGDMVLTVDGNRVPVRWIGTRQIAPRFGNPLRVLPVRISAGALAENIPARDLFVSPDHAMFLGGILVQAGALVNDCNITQESNMPEVFTYYHVEAADHALILAEGAATETFVDNADRMAFDNWGEHEALYGHEAPIAELPYPRAKSARQIPSALRRFLERRMRPDGGIARLA